LKKYLLVENEFEPNSNYPIKIRSQYPKNYRRNYKLTQAFFYEEKYKNSLNMIVKSNLLMNTGLFQKIER